MKLRGIRLIGVALSFCALLVLPGGHWFLLQSIAWTRMVADFSRTDGVEIALRKTFSGSHPCRMCLSIQESRAKEKHSQSKVPLTKLHTADLWLMECQSAVPDAPGNATELIGFIPTLHADFIAAPLTPPPRQS